MLRIYWRQQRALSGKWAGDARYDIFSMRTFARLELGRDAIPEKMTIPDFR
jgi:hypothetical protein